MNKKDKKGLNLWEFAANGSATNKKFGKTKSFRTSIDSEKKSNKESKCILIFPENSRSISEFLENTEI
jgi:hypothetical protein